MKERRKKTKQRKEEDVPGTVSDEDGEESTPKTEANEGAVDDGGGVVAAAGAASNGRSRRRRRQHTRDGKKHKRRSNSREASKARGGSGRRQGERGDRHGREARGGGHGRRRRSSNTPSHHSTQHGEHKKRHGKSKRRRTSAASAQEPVGKVTAPPPADGATEARDEGGDIPGQDAGRVSEASAPTLGADVAGAGVAGAGVAGAGVGVPQAAGAGVGVPQVAVRGIRATLGGAQSASQSSALSGDALTAIPHALRLAAGAFGRDRPLSRCRLVPFRYTGGAWTPTESKASFKSPGTLNAFTWNVFGSGAHGDQRLPVQLRLLQVLCLDSHVVALQDVSAAFLHALQGARWVRRGWWLSDATGETLGERNPGGLVLMTRFPMTGLTLYDLPSGPAAQRQMLVGTLALHGRRVGVVSLQLEQHPIVDTSIVDAQLYYVFKRARAFDDVIIMGDFGFGDVQSSDGHRVNARPMPLGYGDIWLTLDTTDPGFTLDLTRNDMAAALLPEIVSFGSVRSDKLLFRFTGGAWRPIQGGIEGNDRIAEYQNLFPSIRFAVFGEFAFVRPEAAAGIGDPADAAAAAGAPAAGEEDGGGCLIM